MLSMERSLRCTSLVFATYMIHIKAQANFTIIALQHLTWRRFSKLAKWYDVNLDLGDAIRYGYTLLTNSPCSTIV